MLKNYLKIAWRNLWKDKPFTLINTLGLSVAFTMAILLSMAGLFELSYDGFHTNKDNLFKIYELQQTSEGTEAGTSKSTPFLQTLRDEVPGIEYGARVLEDDALAIYGEKEVTLDAIWTDSDFFSMFTFPINKGNNQDLLKDISSLVLSESGAEKLFGRTDVIGETIRVIINGKEEPFTISAVAEKTPSNTEMGFEMAIPFSRNPEYEQTLENWNAQYHEVYVQLEDKVSADHFEQNTKDFTALHYQEVIENAKRDGAQANSDGTYRSVKLLPINDIRFTSFRAGYAKTSRSVPYLILAVAILILFIACVNFVNMSIAKSTQSLEKNWPCTKRTKRPYLGAVQSRYSQNP